MKSIRAFLVVVILAVITLFSFVAALKGYSSSMEEADRLFDQQLHDTARLIANLHSIDQEKKVDQESSFAYQIWQGDRLLASSLNSPSTPITALTPGFAFSNFDGYRWRTVAHFDDVDRCWVLVAERTDLRYTLAENVVLESILPVLLALPLVGILIWVIVGQGLKPLHRLADRLGEKQADDLSPLPPDTSSKELTQIVLSSNTLLARLEKSLLRERQFASDAAHELRTPISTLKVQLHNISHELSGNYPAFIDLSATIQRLGHIVEQILDLYRSSPDQYNASFKPVDLAILAQEVLAEEFSIFEIKNQKLEFEGSSCFISGDRFMLSTLIRNLLSNANKYTPAGGQINVMVNENGESVILTVEDSGLGIPEQQRDAVFERFYRVGGDRHQSGQPGCGLGLAIVQRIVESHGASITIANSSFESGTEFRIQFPQVGNSLVQASKLSNTHLNLEED
ncbi:MAG: two-component system sensor histidine kinase QseC [Lysobacterales bacterium]